MEKPRYFSLAQNVIYRGLAYALTQLLKETYAVTAWPDEGGKGMIPVGAHRDAPMGRVRAVHEPPLRNETTGGRMGRSKQTWAVNEPPLRNETTGGRMGRSKQTWAVHEPHLRA